MNRLVTLAAIAAFSLTASAAGAQTPESLVTWTAKAKPAAVGAQTTVTLTAKIDDGWHIYSVTQPMGGPPPTKIVVPEGQFFTFTPQAAIKQVNNPRVKFDEGFQMKVETYEFGAEFGVPVTIDKAAKTGEQKGQVAVRFQVCNSSTCLPPTTAKVPVAITVTKAGK